MNLTKSFHVIDNKGVKHIYLSEYILSEAINLDSENFNRLNKYKSIQAYKIVNAVRECN